MTSKRRIRFFICFWIAALFLNASSHDSMAKCPTRMGSEFPQDNFLVIAHRGSAAKFPENTIPAFREALDIDGANALEVDLSLTQDSRIILWHDWDPNNPIALIRQKGDEPIVKFKPSSPDPNQGEWRKKTSALTLIEFREHYGYADKISNAESDISIPTFQEFIEWSVKQEKLRSVLFKLKVPADESYLAPVMLRQIKRIIDSLEPRPVFQSIFLTPHKEVLSLVKNQFDDFTFSYDREIPPIGIINYHRFTSIPGAMELKNSFASIGLPIHSGSPTLDPWEIYQHILTLDFTMRDNYKKGTANYIKIISWTFNDEKKIRCLIHLGVDGIVTDKPKMLRKVALEMGKTLD